jgi:hypothetical protein
MKSNLFGSEYYFIYSFFYNNNYYIDVFYLDTLDQLSQTTQISFAFNKDLKPFVVLHPLSSKISQRSSFYDGYGLDSATQFDNSWLYSDITRESPS